MSMNKYIAGIQGCLDTVPSLKKRLVAAFKKVDDQFTSMADIITPDASMIASGTINTSYANVLYRIGDLCYLTLRINGATVDADGTCITLPEGFRPKKATYVDCTASGVFRQATINADGTVTVPNAVSNNNITFFCTYYVG